MKKIIFKNLIFLGALLCFGLTRAQTVTGNVSDGSGPLAGANVLVKGTTDGTQTDFDGNYTLTNVDDNATLVFSYIGFETLEIPVDGQSEISVELGENASELDEVVLIGYGSQRKSDLTGAVGQVSEDELQERSVQSLNQGLAGRVAGVQVNTTSGRPGGKTNVRIRGFSSINSSNNPLYVVDGVQLPQGNLDQYSSAIDFLNPNDVVSIEVLKDASSTAIYGARGANGVILVTTKRGQAGEGRVSYS
ncbi:hypothetical protein LCGC14_1778490, partial [marine sediment metagenome]|nr:SusC/RagA family TonB-linked outer membrane protein [Pricia sp.]